MTKPNPHLGLTEDYRRMEKAVADMTLIWSRVEIELVEVLAEVINDKSKVLASAILFAPTSLDARVAIVDKAFVALLPQLRDSEKIAGSWEKTVEKLLKHKRTRDRVAHGQVVSVEQADGSFAVRLTASLYDVNRLKRDDDGVTLGLSCHELEQSVKAVDLVRMKVGSFATVVRLWRERDVQAYPLVVRGLAD